MVFESIVVEILNKFLGDYVQNLDSSQLKIGIWGGKLFGCVPSQLISLLKTSRYINLNTKDSLISSGDVTLKNLSLKPSALDELNFPVKTVYGHLGE